MRKINTLTIFLIIYSLVSYSSAKGNSSWTDSAQDLIQIKNPIEFIDTYNKYTVLRANKKVKLTDFGNIEKNKNGLKYTLKKYGVQVLNGDKVFSVFKTTTPLKSVVDFNLLYHDKNIVAFRVRDNSTIDYVKNPFRSFSVNTYIYNLSSNKFSTIPVLNSESELDGKQLDLLQGDQLTFNSKKGIYTYLANIKYAKNGKMGIFKVDLNSSLKCISATQGCDNIGISSAEVDTDSK